jgi:hypothetical protein
MGSTDGPFIAMNEGDADGVDTLDFALGSVTQPRLLTALGLTSAPNNGSLSEIIPRPDPSELAQLVS